MHQKNHLNKCVAKTIYLKFIITPKKDRNGTYMTALCKQIFPVCLLVKWNNKRKPLQEIRFLQILESNLQEMKKVIYTTNAIESLNSTYRRLNAQRSVFPSPTALMKALYLATFEASKKWTVTLRNWGRVYGELGIMYEGRLPE